MKNIQKRSLSVVLLLVLLMSLLAGCKEEKPGDTQDDVQAAYRTRVDSAFSDGGYYYINNGLLSFFDFSSGQTVCLCSRAGCKHEDAKCDAYVRTTISVFVWEDHLYYVSRDVTGEKYGFRLYRRNLDGTGLYEVGAFWKKFIEDKKEIGTDYFVALNGKLYYGAELLGKPEPGHVAYENFEGSVICCMDLKTGKEEVIVEHEKARLSVCAVSGDKLIYEEKEIPRNIYDPDYREQMEATPKFLRQYNLTSGENKLLMEENTKIDGLNCKWVKGSLLYLGYRINEQTAIWSIYDLQTGEEAILSDVEGLTFINEKYALRYVWNEEQQVGTSCIYDLQQKKELPMEFVSRSIPAKNENHMIISDTIYKPEGKTTDYTIFYYVPVEALADGLQLSDCTEVYKRYNGAQG